MKLGRIMVAALAATGTTAAAAAPASAAGYDCEASALRASLLGGAAIEPLVANRGTGVCTTVQNTLAELPAELPLLDAQVAVAGTSVSSDAGAAQKVLATGGLAEARVKVLPELPIRLPVPEIPAALASVDVPLLAGGLLGLPSSIEVDLRPAIQALLPDGRLPNVDVVGAKVAMAYAGGGCVNGAPRLDGTSRILGLTVLGQEIPTDTAVDQAFKLVDTSRIDMSQLDLSKVVLPQGLSLTDPAVGTVLQAALQGVLDTLPDIEIPATLAHVKITPNEQARTADRLTQRALHVQVSVLGQSLADVVLGEASVAANSVDCAEGSVAGVAKQPDANDLTLACTNRRLVLTDVVPAGDRVLLEGAADKALAGRTTAIRLLATGRTVARAVIQQDGSFSATAPMPAASIRSTNRARYMATLESERSLDLKLMRRMIVESMEAENGKVTIVGRVVKPLAAPIAPVYLERRISCKKTERVGKAMPGANGRFRITVDAPQGQSAAVYRLTSRVRKTYSNPKTFPTYTLPRGINLLG